jgi:hypothetical protein
VLFPVKKLEKARFEYGWTSGPLVKGALIFFVGYCDIAEKSDEPTGQGQLRSH